MADQEENNLPEAEQPEVEAEVIPPNEEKEIQGEVLEEQAGSGTEVEGTGGAGTEEPGKEDMPQEPPGDVEEQQDGLETKEEVVAENATEEPVLPTQAEESAAPTNVETMVEEATESPQVAVEPISRDQTPPLVVDEPAKDDGELPDDLPRPGTPERQDSVTDMEELLMDEEEEESLPQYNREELLQKYQAALHEREQLNQQNRALQHKLAEYFRKKKTEEVRQEVDKNVTDQEQRYLKYVGNLDELRQQQAGEQEAYNEQLDEMKARKAEKQSRVEEEWSKAVEFKRAAATAAINSRSGRPIAPKDIELYEANERKKEAEVSQVRLENIKLKNRLKKQEMQLKQKEELAEGLHLIDFEQLKIENQTYNEKIEERNEELLKLKKKITSTVQVLTHLKEKLQFVQAENHVKKEQLADVELEVAQKRDVLSRTKQSRDALRHENNKLQQRSGLLGNADLLRDFEAGTDEADDLEHRLDRLKRTHAELTLNISGLKKKIELAKENQS
ncbi:unnamed protein product [Clavelina lepadiformis]|uniref:CCDC113/CCDC96 coiled-coil domain-containing protein n=1 Tax=Clavelina lepadiformis TaxID=159417 RepID=A0ABP0FI99_CLALP